jgi:hypothetical protein
MSDSKDIKVPQPLPKSITELVGFVLQKYGAYAFGLVTVAAIMGMLLFGWKQVKPDIAAWGQVSQVQAQTAETQRLTLELQGKTLEQARGLAEQLAAMREMSAKDLARVEDLVKQMERLYWNASEAASRARRGIVPGAHPEPEPLPRPGERP